MTRVGIYVDCSSLWHGAFAFASDLGMDRPRVDYAKLKEAIRERLMDCVYPFDVPVARAYVTARPKVDTAGFVNVLSVLGYEVAVIDAAANPVWMAMKSDILRDVLDASLDRIVVASQDIFLPPALRVLMKDGRDVVITAFEPYHGQIIDGMERHRLGANVLSVEPPSRVNGNR